MFGLGGPKQDALSCEVDGRYFDRAFIDLLEVWKCGTYRSEIPQKLDSIVRAMGLGGKLLMAWNQRPQISDRSNGVWRRLVLIPWLYTIPEDKIIRGMDQWSYWSQSGEMPGIFLWALQGLLRLMKNGRFTHSDKSREASEAYQIEQNSARAFLTVCVETCRESELIGTRELYTNNRTWAELEGRRPLSNIQFVKEIHRIFPTARRFKSTMNADRSWKWAGIRLVIEDVTSYENSGRGF